MVPARSRSASEALTTPLLSLALRRRTGRGEADDVVDSAPLHGIRPSYRAFGAGHSVLASTSPTLTQRLEADEVSIASHTAWTMAPSRNPGLHGASGQPSSRSAAWLANEEPYPTPWPIGHHCAAYGCDGCSARIRRIPYSWMSSSAPPYHSSFSRA